MCHTKKEINQSVCLLCAIPLQINTRSFEILVHLASKVKRIQATPNLKKSSLTLSSRSHHVQSTFSHFRQNVYFHHFFFKALANELAQNVQDAKAHLRRKRKSEKEGNRMSKCSLVKAASILNMTETDLVDMLDTDEVSIDWLLCITNEMMNKTLYLNTPKCFYYYYYYCQPNKHLFGIICTFEYADQTCQCFTHGC